MLLHWPSSPGAGWELRFQFIKKTHQAHSARSSHRTRPPWTRPLWGEWENKQQQPEPPALTYVVLHFSVMFVHELKQPHFDLGLIQKRFLVLYDFNGNPFLFHSIIGFYDLQRKTGSPQFHQWQCYKFTFLHIVYLLNSHFPVPPSKNSCFHSKDQHLTTRS